MAKKKTKKKKIIADYRKRLRILEAQKKREAASSNISVAVAPERKTIKKSKKKEIVSRTLSVSEKEQLAREARYIGRDLKKTVILSVAGIGILVGLYFFL